MSISQYIADFTVDNHEFLEGPYVRAPKEIGCALTASMLVSPLVSIMDKCMVQEIKGVSGFMSNIATASGEMVTQPKQFFGGLSFKLTVIVYFGTYAVANLSELALDLYKVKHPETRKQLKVSAASVANIGLLAWRDSVFAREFSGSGQAKPKSTPMRTIGLFAARDCATMIATFYLAPKAAKYLQREYDTNKEVAEISTAFVIPVIAQIVTAPLHIHAMDYYNRPVATFDERMQRISAEFGKISFARGLRILPAFGIGSYSNNKFRELTIRQPNEELLLTRKITRLVQRATRAGRSLTGGAQKKSS